MIQCAVYGMTPNDFLDLELWQVYAYLLGQKEANIRKEEDIIKLAYQTASFNNSKRKPKKLSWYLNEIRKKVNRGKVDRTKTRVQLEQDKHNVSRLEQFYKEQEGE